MSVLFVRRLLRDGFLLIALAFPRRREGAFAREEADEIDAADRTAMLLGSDIKKHSRPDWGIEVLLGPICEVVPETMGAPSEREAGHPEGRLREAVTAIAAADVSETDGSLDFFPNPIGAARAQVL
jgi:hypothetical protein